MALHSTERYRTADKESDEKKLVHFINTSRDAKNSLRDPNGSGKSQLTFGAPLHALGDRFQQEYLLSNVIPNAQFFNPNQNPRSNFLG